MELEEMKNRWEEMSLDLEKQKKITDSLIIKMTRAGYQNKISFIRLSETLGSLVGIASFLLIAINFQRLNTWYLALCGVITCVILLLLPLLSLRAIRRLRSIPIVEHNYKEMLSEFSRARIQFISAQKWSFYLGPLLLVAVLPVMGAVIGERDLFKTSLLWLVYAISFPFFSWFAKWVFKSYSRATAAAENILKDLEEQK